MANLRARPPSRGKARWAWVTAANALTSYCPRKRPGCCWPGMPRGSAAGWSGVPMENDLRAFAIVQTPTHAK
eukprot:10121600-Lingulodinium_polyedra.AAC.1